MDPMSAITAGLGALTAGLSALTSIFKAVESGADLLTKVLDSLKGMIKEPQESEATTVTDKTTKDWSEGERTYALAANDSVFSTTGDSGSDLPLAA